MPITTPAIEQLDALNLGDSRRLFFGQLMDLLYCPIWFMEGAAVKHCDSRETLQNLIVRQPITLFVFLCDLLDTRLN